MLAIIPFFLASGSLERHFNVQTGRNMGLLLSNQILAALLRDHATTGLVNQTPGELVGADFFALCAPYVGDIERHVRDAVASERTYRGDMHVMLDKGARRTYEYLLVPVFDPAGHCEDTRGCTSGCSSCSMAARSAGLVRW